MSDILQAHAVGIPSTLGGRFMNSFRFATLCAALGLAAFLNSNSHAQVVASDVASNYSGVTTGTNGGTGFGPWTVTTGSTGFGGIFVGNPGDASITDLANPSFGMYANNGTSACVS